MLKHSAARLLLLAAFALGAGGCTSLPPPETPPVPPAGVSAPTVAVEQPVPPPTPVLPDFEPWLAELRREAEAAGISAATLDAALTGIKPLERVVELDRKQPESLYTFEEYLVRVLPERRIAVGREKLETHRALLEKVSAEFRVPPRIIVALWGVETDYGRLGGTFSIVNALATLAYEGRRAAFFRKELLDALRILDGGDVTSDALRGSWAGAMGQTQFMPSTYLKYAVDFNGDGRRDLWATPADVFASAANYLSKIGWNYGESWGREVQVPKDLDRTLLGLEQRKLMSEWQALGVRRIDKSDLPVSDLSASLVQPTGPEGRAFLVYDNFRVLMQWNRSTYFGVSVGQLADALVDAAD